MNTPFVLCTTPPVKCAPLLTPWQGGKILRRFYGAQMRTKKADGAPAARETSGAHVTTNVTNNIRLTNDIRVRINLFSAGRAAPPPLLMRSGGEKAANLFAHEAIDEALRLQLDREIALMERGENIASNRRRRKLLASHLLQRPYRVVQHFYAAQMRLLAQDGSADQAQDSGFYGDIVHERSTQKTQTIRERHTETQVLRQSGDSPSEERKKAAQIAEIVMRRIDDRMRTRRDRNGIF